MMNAQNRLDRAVDALKNMPVPQGPSTALTTKTLTQIETAEQSRPEPSPWAALRSVGRLGIAATLLLGLGFLGGRLATPAQVDEAQWQALRDSLLVSLEPELTTQMQEQLSDDWQKALVFTYAKLMSEVDQQVDDKLNRYAIQVLSVSHAKTEQALNDLMALIRQNETQQRARIATALEEMEYDRQQTDSEFRASLANVAHVTRAHLKYTEDLITFVSHEQGSASDPNSQKRLPRGY